MAFINEKDAAAVKERLAASTGPVTLLVFTLKDERFCDYCEQTVALLHEVAALSDRLTVEVHDLEQEADLAKQYGIDKVPAVTLLGEGRRDYRMRFYGIPAGYEFGTLIDGIVDVGKGQHRLKPATVEALQRVKAPVHMQVFVTPTWPYCPRAVRTAHMMAMASEHIIADMVEAQEFPELSDQYGVQGVPKTVINEEFEVMGGQPEEVFLAEVLKAAGV